MAELEVTRILQNPLGQEAPPGQRGDIVRVSDGRSKIYLDPAEYERTTRRELRARLRKARAPANS